MSRKTSNAKSPFPWMGGKQKLAEEIVSLFPPHNAYIEVFGGGASVLFTRGKSSVLEVYNDLDDGLVNFFSCLRNRAEELVPLLELTPYSHSEWEKARGSWINCEDPLEKARLWFCVVTQTFAGRVNRPGAPSQDKAGGGWAGEKLGRAHLSRAHSTANRVDHIWKFVDRLRYVQIENLHWRDCLDRYDHPGALFYLDPPYVPDTRRGGGYGHELTLEDHAELVRRMLELKGTAFLSGYDHEIYDPLVDSGYTRHYFDVWSGAAPQNMQVERERDHRREVLWVSPHENDQLFHAPPSAPKVKRGVS